MRLFRFEPRINNWQSYLPLLGVLRGYRRVDLPHDVIAGIVVGIITVPQAVAYAFIAGLPPQAGLYACLLPMIIYAILGSSRHLVVGPVAVAALMVAAAVQQHAEPFGADFYAIATAVSLQVGLILLALRATNMGGIVNLLGHPVVSGFVNAAVILIVISQLSAFTGLALSADTPAGSLIELAVRLREINPTSLIIASVSLVALLLSRKTLAALLRISSNNPLARIGPMLIAILSTALVATFALDQTDGVSVVGALPAGLPSFTLPPFEVALWLDLLPASFMIALVAYVESYSVGATLATRERTRLNANQELIALGAANIGAAFTGAYAAAGSFSRSSVNYSAGGRTPVASLVCATIVAITLLVFTSLFDKLPLPALAAIVIVSVTSLFDWHAVRESWRFYPLDCVTHVVTFLAVLFFGVETGLLAGIGLAIALFVRKSSKPNMPILGRQGQSVYFRSIKRSGITETDSLVIVRIDENIYFANANQIENKLLKIIQRRPAARHLVVVFSSVSLIDASGLEMLERINSNLRAVNVRLHFAEVKHAVLSQLERVGFADKLSGQLFFSTDEAVSTITQPVRPPGS
ncbi:MAG: sulfate permease [Pseudomonadaceae bacterium]|nr:sulfate permease [Pseudomonadaceae bacterium]